MGTPAASASHRPRVPVAQHSVNKCQLADEGAGAAPAAPRLSQIIRH